MDRALEIVYSTQGTSHHLPSFKPTAMAEEVPARADQPDPRYVLLGANIALAPIGLVEFSPAENSPW